MPDRLQEIKDSLKRTAVDEGHFDPKKLNKLQAYKDLRWCVGEIDRLEPFRRLEKFTSA